MVELLDYCTEDRKGEVTEQSQVSKLSRRGKTGEMKTDAGFYFILAEPTSRAVLGSG